MLDTTGTQLFILLLIDSKRESKFPIWRNYSLFLACCTDPLAGVRHAKELPQNNTVKQTTSHGWGLRLGRPGRIMELGNLGNLVPCLRALQENGMGTRIRMRDRIDRWLWTHRTTKQSVILIYGNINRAATKSTVFLVSS